MRWSGYLAHKEEKRNAYTIWWLNLKERTACKNYVQMGG
jgi:hypothetical protein